jgi:hypothetical protein
MDTAVEFKLSASTIVEDKQLIFGWASVAVTKEGETVVDAHDHIIEPLELEEAAYVFVRCGGMGSIEHTEYYAGSLVESIVFTEEKQKALGIPPGTVPIGWWIGMYIYDPLVFTRIKNGELRMLSVAGRAVTEDADSE